MIERLMQIQQTQTIYLGRFNGGIGSWLEIFSAVSIKLINSSSFLAVIIDAVSVSCSMLASLSHSRCQEASPRPDWLILSSNSNKSQYCFSLFEVMTQNQFISTMQSMYGGGSNISTHLIVWYVVVLRLPGYQYHGFPLVPTILSMFSVQLSSNISNNHTYLCQLSYRYDIHI